MKQFLPYFIIQQFHQGHKTGRFEAYTMFIDLSGFTALTEAYMAQGVVGAEKLSFSLNKIFAPLVHLVYQKKGFIPYFAGDAFTAIFPMEETETSIENVLDAALQTRDLFEKQNADNTLFEDFDIGVKIGLSLGNVEWGIVGDEQKSFYFRSHAINGCADAQLLAKQQEIVLDQAFKNQISKNKVATQKIRLQPFYRLKSTNLLKMEQTTHKFKATLSNTEKRILTQFIPKSILRFRQIGEFRAVISVFVAFKNVATYDLLNQFSTIVLNQIQNFSGYFKEIDFGDKGGVMVAFFGAPISFENNIERALEFALALKEETEQLRQQTQLDFKVGITSGEAFTGIIGGEQRVQYAVVGNRVNIAARLMSYANWGEISVDEEIQKEKNYHFQHKGDIRYKGIQTDIPTFSLVGRKEENNHLFTGTIIGREQELQILHDFVEPLWTQHSLHIAYVYGEAGIGKSRLIFEFMRQLEAQLDEQASTEKPMIVKWLSCQADQILQKPFNPFIYFLKNYFHQSPQNTPQKNKANFEAKLSKLFRKLEEIQSQNGLPEKSPLQLELERTQTILAALIGIQYEDSLWNQLDAKGRYRNTLSALSNLFIAESSLQVLIIELEDAHWFDDSSKAFLEELIRNIQHLPVLLLITSRYLDDGSKPRLVPPEKVEQYQLPILELDLNILQPKALRAFAENYLEGTISEEFFQVLQRTTNGNPFYLEQILEYFSESNLLIKEQEKWHIKDKNIKLSNSINAILMARVDRLSSLVKETVKAAAVIGREFEIPVLSAVMKTQNEFIRSNADSTIVLQEQIQTAERGQIWRAMNELRYIFKHSLLREAVYDMQLRTRLRELHQLIGEAIENLYTDNIAERYVDLAFHFEHAENAEKTKFYLNKAAKYAERNFQNQQALRFYNKILSLISPKKEKNLYIKTLLKKGSILESIGDWDACELAFTTALEAAMFSNEKILEARANNSLGKLLMLKGNYEEALHHLETAVLTFESSNDQLGITKSYGNLGNLFFRQGQYEKAKNYFVKSIDLSRSLPYHNGTAQTVSTLGLTYMNQGSYVEGIKYIQEQLVLANEKNDKPAMANLYTNLGIVFFEKGDYDNALDSYEKGLALSQELGNKQLMSIAIGCIGSVYERKGDYHKAQENFEYDLVLSEELGDKQGIAIVHGLLGDLYALKGNFKEAIPHLETQLQLCKELNYQKGIAKALNTLGDVYSFQSSFEQALSYYNQAIDVTQKIDNKLVLGTSLIEKSYSLLYMGRLEEANIAQQKAHKLALQLDNKELIFEVESLASRLLIEQKETTKATQKLHKLLEKATTIQKKAQVYYELSKINDEHKNEAFALYQKLYEETPKHLFRLRLNALRKD